MRSRAGHLAGYLCLLLILVCGTTGCTQQDWMDLADIGKVWAIQHNVINADGSVNKANALKRVFGISTGDTGADAVLDAGMVVKNFADADNLLNQGIDNHDIKKIDSAIAMRPGDYTYINERGAMNYFDGQQQAAQKDFASADTVAAGYGKAAVKLNINSRINSLKTEYDKAVFNKTSNSAGPGEIQALGKSYHQALIENYSKLRDLTDDPQEKADYNRMIQELQSY